MGISTLGVLVQRGGRNDMCSSRALYDITKVGIARRLRIPYMHTAQLLFRQALVKA